MRTKSNSTIYNLIAKDIEGNNLFGRYLNDKKLAKSEVLGHKWVSRINHVRFNGKIYTLKEIMAW